MIHNSKFLIRNSKKGFTLIEILVVISIIGILATLILARLGGVEKGARDARRKSDLNQYRIALENYALKTNNAYPVFNGYPLHSTLCTAATLAPYMGVCPNDPLFTNSDAGTYRYMYKSEEPGSLYILWAKMENYSTPTYYYVCSNGKIGTRENTEPGPGNCIYP